MSFKVALVQLRISDDESPSERCARVLRLLADLGGRADLVVLPELWMTGFFSLGRNYRETELALDSQLIRQLGQIALGRFWLHAGSVLERGLDGALYNASLVFAPSGKLEAIYRKAHLIGYQAQERALLSPGSELASFSAWGACFGLSTCYDLRFPELYRAQLDQGVQVFLITSAWPQARREHWRILVRARAIENLAFLIAANACGTDSGVTYLGESTVVDPWGNVLAQAGAEEGIFEAEINLQELDHVRRTFPVLENRRLVGSYSWKND